MFFRRLLTYSQQDGYGNVYTEDQAYAHNPPTPRSNTASEGVRTRSGRSTGRTDSPFSSSKSRVSKSPARRKNKKGKGDKSKVPQIDKPLSELTKDLSAPVRDIEAWVNRPREERLREVEKRNGYITRPMNSFMLYRSAYADRVKQWGLQNNHQVVSSIAGVSWPMEPEEIRNKFDEWAKLERQHHQEAHPNYKFSPSKSNNKRRKGHFSDDEDEPSDLDVDPDGEYRSTRNVRQRRQIGDPSYLNSTVGFQTDPYYSHQLNGFEQAYQYAKPLPSNIAYDQYGRPYNPQTMQLIQASPQTHAANPYRYQEMHAAPRVPTPGSLSGQQSLGGFGLPGGQDDIFNSSRTSTPMQHYDAYGQPVYTHYHNQYQQAYHGMPSAATPQPGSQQYEHAQYLLQMQETVDPALQAAYDAGTAPNIAGESHFDDALVDTTFGDLGGMPPTDYYGQNSTSPVDVNATLAPTWSPTSELK